MKSQRENSMKQRYAYVTEKAADGSYSAYVLDLSGCITSGETVEEVKQNVRHAVDLHIESLREHNEPVPPSTSVVDVVEVA